MQSPDTSATKAAFRKPLNDAANRKYRRRSPANGSSSSDESPKRDHSSSLILSREDSAKVSELQQRRKDDERELDRDSARSYHGRGGDLYRHSDRHSSRSSHGYSRHDDYVRHEKYVNDEDRNYQRLSSRSGRESKASTHSDYARQDTERSRSKDYLSTDKSLHDRYDVTGHRVKDKERESYPERQKYKDKDSSSDRAGSGRRHTSSNSEETDREWHKRDRDGRDEKRDYRRSSGDYRNDHTVTCEESRGRRSESSGKDYGGYRLKEACRSDPREMDDQKLAKEEKKRYDDIETTRDKDRYYRADKPDFVTEKQETPTKKQKVSNWDKGADYAAEKTSSSSLQAQNIAGNEAFEQAQANDSVANDLDAAKVAAMKAAELVNQNLVGGGYMSTDQKKKLLWGSKKSTTAEESGHRWDTTLFGDRDRQDKFNKLMGVKGDVKVEHKPNNQDGGVLEAEKQRELQLDLEKQYTAGLRRRDGRTVGLGL
ncbi:arginine/serine-rich coiled-coil protein 2 isoform X2 [Melia azedarach]|uniref:Arginine/serine-rich coiled-coil protein 2 isoform X2 n=1 Tax=Melia azedarach TaxID=155640 RepID=A0ACC1X5G8_MELAZ|nr:arginine/serine-rich coiled-coil protein 2 isoform X2 [Melia azedarach]